MKKLVCLLMLSLMVCGLTQAQCDCSIVIGNNNIQNPTCGNSNGVIQLATNGGCEIGPDGLKYEWSTGWGGWNNDAPYHILSGVPEGTYSVTVTDVNGCTDTKTIVLDDGCGGDTCEDIEVNYCGYECGIDGIAYDTTACGVLLDTAHFCVSSGTAPFEWVLVEIDCDDGSQLNGVNLLNVYQHQLVVERTQARLRSPGDTIATTFIVFDLPPGCYEMFATDANGCTGSRVLHVIEEDCCEDIEVNYCGYECGIDGIAYDTTGCGIPLDTAHFCVSSGVAPFDWVLVEIDCNNGSQINGLNLLEQYKYELVAERKFSNLRSPGDTIAYTFIVFDLPPGCYEMFATDANGCVGSRVLYVIEDCSNPCENIQGYICETDGIQVDSIVGYVDCVTGLVASQHFIFSQQAGVTQSPAWPLIWTTPGCDSLETFMAGDTFVVVNIPTDVCFLATATDQDGCSWFVQYTTVDTCSISNNPCDSLFLDLVSIDGDSCSTNSGNISITHTGDLATWSNGMTGSSINGLTAGVYSVTVTLDSCPPLIVSYTVPAIDIDCGGGSGCDSITYQLFDNCDGTADVIFFAEPWVTFVWSDGQVGDIRTVSAGKWQVIATDLVGNCDMSFTFTVEEKLVAEIKSLPPECGQEKGVIDIFVNRNAFIIIGVDTISITGHSFRTDYAPGTYSITIVSDDCTYDTTVVIKQTADLAIDQLIITPSVCEQSNGKVEVSVSGGSGSYSFALDDLTSSTGTFTDVNNEVYTLIVTDDETGCELRQTLEVGCRPACDVGIFGNPSSDGRFKVWVGQYPEQLRLEVWNADMIKRESLPNDGIIDTTNGEVATQLDLSGISGTKWILRVVNLRGQNVVTIDNEDVIIKLLKFE